MRKDTLRCLYEGFRYFRNAVRKEVDKIPSDLTLPRFEESFCREGAIVMVLADQYAKGWLLANVGKFELWEGAKFKAGGVELMQRVVRATSWIPGGTRA